MNATPIILWMLPGTRDGGRDLSIVQRLNRYQSRPGQFTTVPGRKPAEKTGSRQRRPSL